MVYLRKDRHDALRDKLFEWMRNKGLQVEREVPLRRIQVEGVVEPKAKIMDLVLLLQNTLTWCDVTVINGNTESHRESGETRALKAAAAAKSKKYAAHADNQHADMYPAAMECAGGFSKTFTQLLDKLVEVVWPRETRFIRSRNKRSLMASLSVTMVKMQSKMLDVFSSSYRNFAYAQSNRAGLGDASDAAVENPNGSFEGRTGALDPQLVIPNAVGVVECSTNDSGAASSNPSRQDTAEALIAGSISTSASSSALSANAHLNGISYGAPGDVVGHPIERRQAASCAVPTSGPWSSAARLDWSASVEWSGQSAASGSGVCILWALVPDGWSH
jgi:hypothetical protein